MTLKVLDCNVVYDALMKIVTAIHEAEVDSSSEKPAARMPRCSVAVGSDNTDAAMLAAVAAVPELDTVEEEAGGEDDDEDEQQHPRAMIAAAAAATVAAATQEQHDTAALTAEEEEQLLEKMEATLGVCRRLQEHRALNEPIESGKMLLSEMALSEKALNAYILCLPAHHRAVLAKRKRELGRIDYNHYL